MNKGNTIYCQITLPNIYVHHIIHVCVPLVYMVFKPSWRPPCYPTKIPPYIQIIIHTAKFDINIEPPLLPPSLLYSVIMSLAWGSMLRYPVLYIFPQNQGKTQTCGLHGHICHTILTYTYIIVSLLYSFLVLNSLLIILLINIY